MTERALANKIRIAIVEEIAKIDLPGFLFEQIDKSLFELNYFKLSNLYNNIHIYTQYLGKIQKNYHMFIKENNPRGSIQPLPKESYMPLYTDKMMEEDITLCFNRQDIIKIESIFGVTCLLRMKEFINRRILQHKEQSKRFKKIHEKYTSYLL